MKIGNENFEKILFLKFELKFLFFNFQKHWPYHKRGMENFETKSILAIPPEKN
jgi:hypothetical protein